MKIVVTESIRECLFFLLESMSLLFVHFGFPSVSGAYSFELESMLLSWFSASPFLHSAVGPSVVVVAGIVQTRCVWHLLAKITGNASISAVHHCRAVG